MRAEVADDDLAEEPEDELAEEPEDELEDEPEDELEDEPEDELAEEPEDELAEEPEEELEEEPEDETEREAVWAPAARLSESPGSEDFAAVELRSDLARHLDRSEWPVTGGRLLEILTERNAGDRLVELAGTLPKGQRYASLSELLRALDLEPEERGS